MRICYICWREIPPNEKGVRWHPPSHQNACVFRDMQICADCARIYKEDQSI